MELSARLYEYGLSEAEGSVIGESDAKGFYQIVGLVTDFQILGDLFYAVNANGFFSIKRLVKMEKAEVPREGDDNRQLHRFLSATPLQASYPTSIAVGAGYAYMLATPEASKR